MKFSILKERICGKGCIYPERACKNCLERLTLDPGLTHDIKPGAYIDAFNPKPRQQGQEEKVVVQ